MTDIATAVIPLGARLQESEIAALEERLTIKSVNNDLDYIENAEGVKKYGFIVKTVTWDDVTTPEMLLSKGKKWLTDEQFESMVIDVKAVDLHYTAAEENATLRMMVLLWLGTVMKIIQKMAAWGRSWCISQSFTIWSAR